MSDPLQNAGADTVRGRRRPPSDGEPTSWDSAGLPILAEHRETLAGAEAEAAYLWAAGAVEGRDVLVVGSGAGHGVPHLHAAGAATIAAIDPDPRAVEVATRLYGELATFKRAEPLAMGLAAASFDAIVCLEALESSPDPGSLLDSFGRALRKDGILLASLGTDVVRDPVTGAELAPPRTATEWRRELGGRYANLALYRRRLSLTAIVQPLDPAPGDDADPAPAGRQAAVGGDPAEDRSLLVAASDGPIPELDATAVSTGSRDLRAYRETISAWEQRARKAEADGSAKHWELVASREAQRRLRKRLHELEHRPLRRISRMLRGRPGKLGPGPPIRDAERPPEPWD